LTKRKRVQFLSVDNNEELERTARAAEATILCGMGNGPYVEPNHSLFKYMASEWSADANKFKFFAAIGDRIGGRDPPFVNTTPAYFGWKDAKLLKAFHEDSAFGKWFAATGKRLKFFDATTKETKNIVSSSPSSHWYHPKSACRIVQRPTTMWELMALETKFGARDVTIPCTSCLNLCSCGQC